MSWSFIIMYVLCSFIFIHWLRESKRLEQLNDYNILNKMHYKYHNIHPWSLILFLPHCWLTGNWKVFWLILVILVSFFITCTQWCSREPNMKLLCRIDSYKIFTQVLSGCFWDCNFWNILRSWSVDSRPGRIFSSLIIFVCETLPGPQPRRNLSWFESSWNICEETGCVLLHSKYKVEINILMLLMREIRATSVNLSAFYLPSCCVGVKIGGFFLEPSVNII